MTSIRTRILIFFTAFSLVSLFAIYMSNRSTSAVGESFNVVVTDHLPMVHALGQLDVALQRQDNAVYRYLMTGKSMWIDECEKERLNYERFFSQIQEIATETTEQDLLTQIDELYVQYDNQTRQIMLTASHSSERPRQMLERNAQYLASIQNLVDQLTAMRYGMTLRHREEIKEATAHHKRFAFLFFGAVVVLFIGLALYLWYFLVKPLSLLLDGIRNFTRGKTDVRIPAIGKDELGELQEAFNEMSTEINVERRRLTSESQSDSLTSLFNMRYFRRQLVEEFSRAQRYNHPLSLIMIDVDHFKSYNDRNGHPAGDIVLKEVARILIRNVRGTDIVARYGGEEFVVLLPETPADAAASVAEKIRKTVEEHHFPFRETQSGGRLTVSIGVGSFPDPRVTSDQDMIESADKALYAAKQNGRNQVRAFLKGETTSPLSIITPTVKPQSASK
jgi:diguanylate cyclase (GGDEF)-like protein